MIELKNKGYIILAIVLSVSSIILLFIGITTNLLLAGISFLGFLIGIYMVMDWSTISYKWICDECEKSFEITVKQNIFSLNAGINYKRLYCPNCKKKTYCKGILK